MRRGNALFNQDRDVEWRAHFITFDRGPCDLTCLSASNSACWSSGPPLAHLMMRTPSRIMRMAPLSMILRILSMSGACKVTIRR